MIWEYVLKIKVGDKIIYDKNNCEKDICIQNRKTNVHVENNYKRGTLPMEVLKHARTS